MGVSAARKTDKTTHGGDLIDGEESVKINSLAAVRFGDWTSCPLADPKPHLGGVVQVGSGLALTVLIGGQPAAVVGGSVPCTKGGDMSPNNVVAGSGNVHYTPSNTIAGLEVRDGPMKNGVPTILVGNGIVIRGGGAWGGRVLADLARIATTDIGRKRLQSIDASGHTVDIVYPTTRRDHTTVQNDANSDDGSPQWLGGTGRGADAKVEYDPHDHNPYVPRPTTTDITSDVVLFHELTHADHLTHGEAVPSERKDDWHNDEERRTITQDENLYRIQRGIKKLRDNHSDY